MHLLYAFTCVCVNFFRIESWIAIMFSVGSEKYFSDPTLDVRSTYANTCKSVKKKHANSAPQILMPYYQPPTPIERVMFQ